jgi:hypothetical protein
MFKCRDIPKCFALAGLAIALCWSSIALAQTAKKRANLQAAAPAVTAPKCLPGAGPGGICASASACVPFVSARNPADGSCTSYGQCWTGPGAGTHADGSCFKAGECKANYGKWSDGSCITVAQYPTVQGAVVMASCMTSTRINYNWCALGKSFAPLAKDIFVFDQSLAGVASSPGGAASDIRFKRDIAQVALRNDGIALYSFRYFWSDQVYVGVMAQQVAGIAPEAVIMHDNGYLWVDYDRLGLKMQTLQEWQASGATKASLIVAAP